MSDEKLHPAAIKIRRCVEDSEIGDTKSGTGYYLPTGLYSAPSSFAFLPRFLGKSTRPRSASILATKETEPYGRPVLVLKRRRVSVSSLCKPESHCD